MAPAVVAGSLTKRFGTLVAVDDLSLCLSRGAATRLIPLEEVRFVPAAEAGWRGAD
jgi:hypothetical protein